MTKYRIVTESGSDLPKEYVERYKIKIVPMHVTFAGQTYKDGEVSPEDVYSHFDKTESLAQTSGSTPFDFTEAFQEIRDEDPEATIIYIAYSSVTTVSYNSARIASADFDNIYLIDSKNCSLGNGTVVIEAAKFIEENPEVSPQEIIDFVEDVRERTRFVFLPQSLLYLKSGGRISNASYLGAILLKIFPTITLENGYLVAGKKYRGSFKKAISHMIDDYFSKYNIDKSTVRLIKVSRIKDDQIAFIEEKVREKGIENIEWVEAGAVIGTHGGPGAMGICGIEY